jgi:hypothetical protein
VGGGTQTGGGTLTGGEPAGTGPFVTGGYRYCNGPGQAGLHTFLLLEHNYNTHQDYLVETIEGVDPPYAPVFTPPGDPFLGHSRQLGFPYTATNVAAYRGFLPHVNTGTGDCTPTNSPAAIVYLHPIDTQGNQTGPTFTLSSAIYFDPTRPGYLVAVVETPVE